MDNNTLAQRTCLQCKASKKRCDKTLPRCSRCERLSIECIYNEQNGHNSRQNGQIARQNDHVPNLEPADPRFEDIFQRLQRLESHVFPPNATPKPQPTAQEDMIVDESPEEQTQSSPHADPLIITSSNWALNPGHLWPRHMGMIVFGSLMTALKEHKTTIRAVSQTYFAHTHKWLPIIWQEKFERQVAEFNVLDGTDNFVLLVLVMQLLVTPPSKKEDHGAELCPWYRTCKYHFAQYVALGEPCIELVQMGMLVALYEYLQAMEDRALTTLGICVRIAYDLEMDDIVSRRSSCQPGEMKPENEEVVLTWWGLSRLERYFNMPPTPFPKHPSMPLGLENAQIIGGPPTTRFSTISSEILEYSVLEHEAACTLARVQTFIRSNRHAPASSMSSGVEAILHTIQENLVMLRIKHQSSGGGSWAGISVNLGAALQLLLFHTTTAQKTSIPIPHPTLLLLHSIITQIRDVINECRLINGFTENYMEGIQPTWFSVPIMALQAYRLIKENDMNGEGKLGDVDMAVCWEILGWMAEGRRYGLAEKCLRVLRLEL